MKKVLALMLAAVLICTACGAEQSDAKTETAEEECLSIVDDLERTVTVHASPQRVAAMIGSFADVWCLAGGKETLAAAADDTWTQFDLKLGEDVVHLGGVKMPNLELLLAAKPDLVIASAKSSANLELEPVLEELGIPVLYFRVSSFEDYLHMLDICTQLTGQRDAYEMYGVAVQQQIDRAVSRVHGEAPDVLYIRATGSSCKVKNSKDSVLGEMLEDLGCRNIADSQTGLLEQLSLETILRSDPDYIFAVLQGSDDSSARATFEQTLMSNPAWEKLTAVQEGRFYVLDQKLYNLKPNDRWGEAYEQLAELLYPQK